MSPVAAKRRCPARSNEHSFLRIRLGRLPPGCSPSPVALFWPRSNRERRAARWRHSSGIIASVAQFTPCKMRLQGW